MHYSSTKQCSSSEMVVVVTKWLPSNTDTETYTLEQLFVCRVFYHRFERDSTNQNQGPALYVLFDFIFYKLR